MTPPILSHLAQQITKEIALADKAYENGVDHAIRAGGLLRRAKAQLKHGAWTAWLQKNCSLSARQARRYMAIHQACGTPDTRGRYPSMQAVLDGIFRSNHPEWFGTEAEEDDEEDDNREKETRSGPRSRPKPASAGGESRYRRDRERRDTETETGQTGWFWGGSEEQSERPETSPHHYVYLKLDSADLPTVSDVWDAGYRAVSMKLHPDVPGGDARKMLELNRVTKAVREQLKKAAGGETSAEAA